MTSEAEGAEDLIPIVPKDLFGPIEAILIQTSEPVDVITLAEVVDAPVGAVEEALGQLVEHYSDTNHGFELREVAGGWRFWSKADYAKQVETWVTSGQQAKLSQAALETLAVIAYLQPISRQRISSIRGVNVDSVVKTLVARGLIEESETDEQTHAQLFSTSELFLEKLGLASLDDLPPLAPLLPEATELADELNRATHNVDLDQTTLTGSVKESENLE